MSGSKVEFWILVIWIVSIPLLISSGLWASKHFAPGVAIGAMALGIVVGDLVLMGALRWKGTAGIGLTLLLLVITSRWGLNWMRVVLVLSGWLSVEDGARSQFAFALVALMLSFIPFDRMKLTRERPAMIATVTGFLVVGVMYLFIRAMELGVLGPVIEARTNSQLQSGGNLLVGSRVEWAGTSVLFQNQPWGFGIGTQVSYELQRQGLGAIKEAGGNYEASYFDVFVFGSRADLHSIAADLWFHFSAGGVVFGLGVLILLASSIPNLIGARPTVRTFGFFAVMMTAWDLLFSPMGNSDRLILGVIVVVLASRPKAQTSVDIELAALRPASST